MGLDACGSGAEEAIDSNTGEWSESFCTQQSKAGSTGPQEAFKCNKLEGAAATKMRSITLPELVPESQCVG